MTHEERVEFLTKSGTDKSSIEALADDPFAWTIVDMKDAPESVRRRCGYPSH